MPEIIGVRFKNTGKVYYFDPGDYTIHYHDHVIVETARGIDYGTVVITPTEIPEEKVANPLRRVIRMATEDDDTRERENAAHEKEAFRICRQKIAERGLDMKLIRAEYTFDNSKILFYFTADGRIDFRELVKDLAGIFRTRIELRQIGVRDETRLLGGIGSCGRPLCCHTWLGEFAPVSIKMAKDQNLSLNPTKISGSCGRLMCCLKNEAETYASLNKGLPGKGDYVTTPDGLHGDVVSVNILRQRVKVIVDIGNDEKEMQEFDVADISFIPKSKRPKKENPRDAARKGEHGEEKRSQKSKGASEENAPGEEKRAKNKRNRRSDRRDGSARELPAGADGAVRLPAESGEQAAVSSGAERDGDAEKRKRRRRRPHRRNGAKAEGSGEAACKDSTTS